MDVREELRDARGELARLKAEKVRDRESERVRAQACRAVELVPGRAAARVEFTAEEMDALQVMVMGEHGSEAAERRFCEFLERAGIGEDVHYRTMAKVLEAGHQLLLARQP